MGKKRRKNKDGISVLALLVSLVIVGIVSIFGGKFLINQMFPDRKEVEMPKLTGLTLQEAQAKLKESNIEIKKTTYQEDDVVEKNHVIYQYPQSGIRVKENVSIVELIVSEGKSEVEVPNVLKYTLDNAKTVLDSNDLRYMVTEEPNDEIPIGCISRQNPAAGKMVEIGMVIELYVSSGPTVKMTLVPDLVGKTPSEAKALLEANKLGEGEVTYESNNSKSNGIILSQKVLVGTSVEEGTKIGYVVNKITPVTPQTPNKKTLPIYISLANKGIEGRDFTVRVEISGGGYIGKQVLYEKVHNRADEGVLLNISGNGQAMIEIFIDGVRDSAQEIKFN